MSRPRATGFTGTRQTVCAQPLVPPRLLTQHDREVVPEVITYGSLPRSPVEAVVRVILLLRVERPEQFAWSVGDPDGDIPIDRLALASALAELSW